MIHYPIIFKMDRNERGTGEPQVPAIAGFLARIHVRLLAPTEDGKIRMGGVDPRRPEEVHETTVSHDEVEEARRLMKEGDLEHLDTARIRSNLDYIGSRFPKPSLT